MPPPVACLTPPFLTERGEMDRMEKEQSGNRSRNYEAGIFYAESII
jgi:hypothetical protein